MLIFRNVSLFEKENYGVKRLSFEVKSKRRLFVKTAVEEQCKYISWLITGKVNPQGGFIDKPNNYFCQSDRWWLENEKFIESNVEKWLNLGSPYIRLDEQRTSKHTFVDKLKANSILHMKIHRLKDDELAKFVCLSLLFQQSGCLVLSEIWKRGIHEKYAEIIELLIRDSPIGIALVDSSEDNPLLKLGDKWETQSFGSQ